MFLTIGITVVLCALAAGAVISMICDVRTHRFWFQRPDPPERQDHDD
jgi:hypothetical protein